MITCPNKNLPEWKQLVRHQGEAVAYYLWNQFQGFVPSIYYEDGPVSVRVGKDLRKSSRHQKQAIRHSMKVEVPEAARLLPARLFVAYGSNELILFENEKKHLEKQFRIEELEDGRVRIHAETGVVEASVYQNETVYHQLYKDSERRILYDVANDYFLDDAGLRDGVFRYEGNGTLQSVLQYAEAIGRLGVNISYEDQQYLSNQMLAHHDKDILAFFAPIIEKADYPLKVIDLMMNIFSGHPSMKWLNESMQKSDVGSIPIEGSLYDKVLSIVAFLQKKEDVPLEEVVTTEETSLGNRRKYQLPKLSNAVLFQEDEVLALFSDAVVQGRAVIDALLGKQIEEVYVYTKEDIPSKLKNALRVHDEYILRRGGKVYRISNKPLDGMFSYELATGRIEGDVESFNKGVVPSSKETLRYTYLYNVQVEGDVKKEDVEALWNDWLMNGGEGYLNLRKQVGLPVPSKEAIIALQRFQRVRGGKVIVTPSSAQYTLLNTYDKVVTDKKVKEAICLFTHELSTRIGMNYTFIDDPSESYKGVIEGNLVTINLAYADEETVVHELFGHPIIRSIKMTNRALYDKLLAEAKSLPGSKELMEQLKRNYTGTKEYLEEEFLVTFVSKEAAEFYKAYLQLKARPNSTVAQNRYQEIVEKIFNAISDFLRRLFKDERFIVIEKLDQNTKIKDIIAIMAKHDKYIVLPNEVVGYVSPVTGKIKQTREEVLKELKGLERFNGTLTDMDIEKMDEEYKEILSKRIRRRISTDLKEFIAFKKEKERFQRIITSFKNKLLEKERLSKETLNFNISFHHNRKRHYLFDNEHPITDFEMLAKKPLVESAFNLSRYVLLDEDDNIQLLQPYEVLKYISHLKKDKLSEDIEFVVRLLEHYSISFDEESDFRNMYDVLHFIYNIIQKEEKSILHKLQWDINDRKGLVIETIAHSPHYLIRVNFDNRNYNEFVNKNIAYEISRIATEKWKKENNIVYDPEEAYSRGFIFYSVVGAYNYTGTEMFLRNLLKNIIFNESVGEPFLLSAVCHPFYRKSEFELERFPDIRGGFKEHGIRIRIFPTKEDIYWMAAADVHSGSVWDSSNIIAGKPTAYAGMIYTKYPRPDLIPYISPSVSAAIYQGLNKISNNGYIEAGIRLRPGNFILESNRDNSKPIKELVDHINKRMREMYGEIKEPVLQDPPLLRQMYKVERGFPRERFIENVIYPALFSELPSNKMLGRDIDKSMFLHSDKAWSKCLIEASEYIMNHREEFLRKLKYNLRLKYMINKYFLYDKRMLLMETIDFVKGFRFNFEKFYQLVPSREVSLMDERQLREAVLNHTGDMANSDMRVHQLSNALNSPSLQEAMVTAAHHGIAPQDVVTVYNALTGASAKPEDVSIDSHIPPLVTEEFLERNGVSGYLPDVLISAYQQQVSEGFREGPLVWVYNYFVQTRTLGVRLKEDPQVMEKLADMNADLYALMNTEGMAVLVHELMNVSYDTTVLGLFALLREYNPARYQELTGLDQPIDIVNAGVLMLKYNLDLKVREWARRGVAFLYVLSKNSSLLQKPVQQIKSSYDDSPYIPTIDVSLNQC